MRPNGLLLAIATTALCSLQPRTVAQIPIYDVATSSYAQESDINGTIATLAKVPASESIATANLPPTAAAAAATDISAPALDKSIFSLIVFGIAGLCLL